MAGHARKCRKTPARAHHRRAHPAADPRARSALPVRAAQTCAPRLHGAEGGRDGRVPPAADPHPARPGRPRQPRAHARKCHRGSRAVRRPDAARNRDPADARADDRRVRPRPPVFCDEEAEVKDPLAALSEARSARGAQPMALAVLVGPEGGFAADERAALLKMPNAVRLALGPRTLRADTAAVAALALVGAVLGDWR